MVMLPLDLGVLSSKTVGEHSSLFKAIHAVVLLWQAEVHTHIHTPSCTAQVMISTLVPLSVADEIKQGPSHS